MKKYVLKNGLKVLFHKIPGKSLTVYASVAVGSINESKGQKGYSHFVEHMLFEGTLKRPDAQLITEVIENVGGDINAATSNDTTYYYAKVLSRHYSKAIDVLSDMLMNSVFNPEKVKKEAQVILEEIKMINDQPRYYQWIAFEEVLFKGSQYQFPVYGFQEDVRAATPESLKKYYSMHYVPENCTLAVVGAYSNEKEILKTIESFFGSWKAKKHFAQVIAVPQSTPRTKIYKKPVSQAYVVCGSIVPGSMSKESAVFEIIEAILGKPQSGWMNHEIRNKRGLAYDVGVSYEHMLSFGFFAINVGTDIASVDLVLSLINRELLRLETVSKEDLAFAKAYVEGKLIMELESTTRSADSISYWDRVAGKDYSKEYLRLIKSVSASDVAVVAKKFLTNLTVVKVLPSENSENS